MKALPFLSVICVALLCFGCSHKKEESKQSPLDSIEVVDIPDTDAPDLMMKDPDGFPKVKNLTDYKQTTFLFAPDCSIPPNKNSIYCLTLGIAWGQIKALLPSSYKIDKRFTDLQLLDQSEEYDNSLKKGDYEAVVDVSAEQLKIGAKVKFNKTLPFETVFDSNPDNDFTFMNNKVASFSASGGYVTYNSQVEILYYKNDNNFIVKLQPKDLEHEILLYLPGQKPKTLAEGFLKLKFLRDKGNKQRKDNWRYEMISGDYMAIPKLSFNIENDYESMKGNEINTDVNTFYIDKMKQQTAFMLDEYGAKIEGQAEAAVAAAHEVREDKPIPKKLIFNKPFLIILKRKDSPNPYFAIWVDNTELMQKQ